jgi:hypothetical protein
MESGKTQLQQMSVIGFTKRPWQVEAYESGAVIPTAKITTRRRRLKEFIDPQAIAFL